MTNFLKLLDERDVNRFSFEGDALEAIVEIDKMHYTRDMTIGEAEMVHEERVALDKIGELAKELCTAVNRRDSETVAKAFLRGFAGEHRTLQAQAFDSLLKFLKLYADSSYDLRNRAAVLSAERLSQVVEKENIFIPLI